MNRLLKLICILVIFSFQVNAVDADQGGHNQWNYINPLQPKGTFFIISTNPDFFGVEDVAFNAEYCKPDNEFICIKNVVGFEFEFYVPRRSLSSKDTWNIKGVEYQVTFKRKRMIFGIEDFIYYIDKPQDNYIMRFLYSSTRGLIGFGGISKNSSGFFLLNVKCGFGAPSRCPKKYNKNLKGHSFPPS